MHDPDAFRTEIAQHFGKRHQPARREDAEQLAFCACRIGEGAKQVEDRPRAEFDAAGADMAHGRMVQLREHEAETRLADAAGDELGTDIELHAKRGECVCRAGFGAQRPVAMLGDGQARSGDDDRGECRDIIGADAVTAGSDDIDGIGGSRNRQHAGAHGGDGADDFVHRFAAHAQRHQEAANLRRRGFARHQNVESRPRFLAVQALSICDLGDQRLQFGHLVAPRVRSRPSPDRRGPD